VDWVDMAQDRNQGGGLFCEYGIESSGYIKFWEVLE
jgi:hypothetical protein